jgi:hypothetical protein
MASRPRSSCVLKGPRRRTSPGAGDLLNGRVVSQIINSNDPMTWSCAWGTQTATEGLFRLILKTVVGRVPLSCFSQVVEEDGPNQIQGDNHLGSRLRLGRKARCGNGWARSLLTGTRHCSHRGP